RVGTMPDAGVREAFFQRPTSLSADGGRAATTGENGTLIVWDLVTGKELQRFEVEPAVKLATAALTPDGKGLLIATHPGQLVLCDVAAGKGLRRFEVPEAARGAPAGGEATPVRVDTLAFSPDGKLLAAPFFEVSRENGSFTVGVRLWDVA